MQYNKAVKVWLVIGCVMLFFQIFIGGVTRITGSGLSITKWEIVTGTLPPFSDSQWEAEFDLYKETPQYKKINDGMSMSKFKFIYFWEYFHRLWARMMGFVFLFPFIFFVFKKWLDRKILFRLAYVILAAMTAAIFGWIMVASGLVNRPWVNAYKLSLHLGIALVTYCLLLWTTFMAFKPKLPYDNQFFKKAVRYLFIFLAIQIFFGAIVSGMRASLYYPSWPDMNGHFIPPILFEPSAWNIDNLIEYDKNSFMPALIHVLHRNWGYFVYFFGIYLAIKMLRYPLLRRDHIMAISLIVLLNLQVLLGILTLVNSQGTIPVFYGVMHQSIAIFILTVVLFMNYAFRQQYQSSQ